MCKTFAFVICLMVAMVSADKVEKNDTVFSKVIEQKVIDSYKNAFNSNNSTLSNRTLLVNERMQHFLNQKNNTNSTTKNITAEINLINKQIEEIKKQQLQLNETIIAARHNAALSTNVTANETTQKIHSLKQAAKELEELSDKKEELENAKIDLIREEAIAKRITESTAEEMRRRRRYINDLERKHREEQKTTLVVNKVKEIEYKKLINKLKELENTKEEIQRLKRAEEMKQLALEKKERRIRVINDRKHKILFQKLKAAKIAKNAELIAQIDKQLAELQTYKSRQIRCARRKFEQYKIKERRKLEAKKIALFNKKLLNELSEHKSYALDDVKRALQEEIDKLRLTKELFDHEQLTEKKKLDALSSLQKKTIKDSKRRAKLRREIYKLKRKELLKAQMRTLSKRASEYTHKVNKNILEHTVESTRKMVRKTDRLQRKLNLLDSEIQHKKKLLQLESQDADTSIALERIQIQKLKNQYYMLQALREKQKAQNKVHKYMLKHNNKMEDLDEIESKSKIEMLNHVLQKKGIQKSVIEDTKQNSAAALKQLKAKLKKEYELKKKVLNLKRCLRTRLVVNDAVKRKEAENKMKDMVRKIVIARLKAMNNTCSPHNKLAKKVSK